MEIHNDTVSSQGKIIFLPIYILWRQLACGLSIVFLLSMLLTGPPQKTKWPHLMYTPVTEEESPFRSNLSTVWDSHGFHLSHARLREHRYQAGSEPRWTQRGLYILQTCCSSCHLNLRLSDMKKKRHVVNMANYAAGHWSSRTDGGMIDITG